MELPEEELKKKIAFARERQRQLRKELNQKFGESGYEHFCATHIHDTTPTINAIQQEDAPMRCPRCGSSQLTANQKGFGTGKAAVGVLLAGPIGLLGGFIGSGKIKITCLKCGHEWMP